VRLSGVTPELADSLGALEVGQHQDTEQFGAGAGPKASRRCRSRRSTLWGRHGEEATLRRDHPMISSHQKS
jgi:hypothetical protein